MQMRKPTREVAKTTKPPLEELPDAALDKVAGGGHTGNQTPPQTAPPREATPENKA
jgi:hypothetical protein